MQVGGALVTGAAAAGAVQSGTAAKAKSTAIKRYRILGRTGFKVSDIGLGAGPLKEVNMLRYLYDKGVNYFDTAESYGQGQSERTIGEAMQFMDRKKIFVTTKIHVGENDNKEILMDHFSACQERLKTDYVDALYIWGINTVDELKNPHFHSAAEQLKADGRIKHIGISCHGPRGGDGDSMEAVCSAAAEDGRFDLMLFAYNFMNSEAAEKILAVCKKKNVGTTAMKTAPGVFEQPEDFNAENLNEDQENYIERMKGRGMAREQAIERLRNWNREQHETWEKTTPFTDRYKVTSAEHLRKASIQWVLNNPDMHTVCVSMTDFDAVDTFTALSGTTLSRADSLYLKRYAEAHSRLYCRHACRECLTACPNGVPVSTIMRYATYFRAGRQRDAMIKYGKLGTRQAKVCLTCDAPCQARCPHGIPVQASLIHADQILTLV